MEDAKRSVSNARSSRERPMTPDHDLARRFAPVLHLHPGEPYLPMGADEFVRGSRLCLVQLPDPTRYVVVAAFDPETGNWQFNPEDGRHFGLSVPALGSIEQAGVPDGSAWSRRPFGSERPADGNYFVLQNRSSRPPGGFDPARPPPCYWHAQRWGDDTAISYWFFYGYSEFLGPIGHQGDWEHVTVRIRDGQLVGALFAVHEVKYFVRPDEMELEDGRLQIYSARARHATWWKEGDHSPGIEFFKDREKIEAVRGLPSLRIQDVTARGPAWDLRARLEPLSEQPWRTYGGAWGALGRSAATTGPLGAWQKRDLDPQEEVILE